MLNLSHYEQWFRNVLADVVNMLLPAQIFIQVHSQELTSFFQLVFTYSLQTCIIYINVMICMIKSRIWRFQNYLFCGFSDSLLEQTHEYMRLEISFACTKHLDHFEILTGLYNQQRRGLVSLRRQRWHLGTEWVPKWTPAAPHIAKCNIQIFLHQIQRMVFYLTDNLPSRFLQCL